MAVDGPGDVGGLVAYGVANLLDWYAVAAHDRDCGVAAFVGVPVANAGFPVSCDLRRVSDVVAADVIGRSGQVAAHFPDRVLERVPREDRAGVVAAVRQRVPLGVE